MRRSYSDEVVDDSEPEREAQRQAEAASKALQQPVSRGASIQHNIDIIEISDDDELEPVKRSDTRFQSIIEISDDSISIPAGSKKVVQQPSKIVDAAITRNTGVNSSTVASVPTTVVQHDNRVGPSKAFLSSSKLQNDSDSDASSSLSLSRFAFVNARGGPSKPKPLKANAVKPTVSKPNMKADAPSKGGQTNNKQSVLDISGNDMSTLLKCVCCDAHWTARKGTKQKMTHIQSCAKKHGLRDDTVYALIRKELKAASAKTSTEVPVETFFDEVVHDAAPKKRVRRQVEVTATVKNLCETREDILAKAKTVVAQNNSEVRAWRERSGHTDDMHYGHDSVSSTPDFGQSKLAGRNGSKIRSLFNVPSPPHTDIEDEQDLLASPTPSSRQPVLRDTDAANINTKPTNPLTLSHNVSDLLSSSSNVTSPGPSVIDRVEVDADIPDIHDNPYYHDDAFLHYDPAFDVQTPHDSPCTSDSDSPRRTTHPATPILPHTNQIKPSGNVSPITTITPKRKAIRKGAKKAEQADEEWEQEIKDKILQDVDLHHRILRFEPIHFSVFLKLVEGSTVSGTLKNRLRVFLDKQGINFYGSEPASRRRR